MSELEQKPASAWSRLWQIPILLLGIGLFLFGIRAFQHTRPITPFEAHVTDIEKMLVDRQYEAALKQINKIQNYYVANPQQAQLEVLAGDAFYGAQLEQPKVVAANYQAVLKHYRQAVKYGFKPTPLFEERWGLSALALGEIPEAIQKLEPLVKPNPLANVALSRALVTAYLSPPTKAAPDFEPKPTRALEILAQLSKVPGLDDRIWALVTRLKMTQGQPESAAVLAEAATEVETIKEHQPNGLLRTALGEALYEAGRFDEAEAQLLLARKQYEVLGPRLEDGRAALLLGRIAQSRAMSAAGQARQDLLTHAEELYQYVLTTHAGSPIMLAARFGRAEVAAYAGRPDERMQRDYEWVIKQMTEAPPHPAAPPELLTVEAVQSSLIHQHAVYQAVKHYRTALLFLNLAHQIKVSDVPGMALRDAITQEALADELAQSYRNLPVTQPNRGALLNETLQYYQQAAEAYYRHSHLSAMKDEVSRESLWKAAQLFDQAGMAQRSMATYNEFVRQWPKESRVPEALHTVGLLHESLGEFAEAIAVYQRNMRENPKTPASYLSTVQLACSHMALGPSHFAKAEQALLLLVNDNRDLQPTANEFRISLFKLGDLYYRTGRWSDAILRMEEACTRYPDDPQVPRVTYYLADAYRHSAGELVEVLKKEPQNAQRDQLESQRQDRLKRAGALFDKVITLLDPENDAGGGGGEGDKPGPTGLNEEYLRNCYLYRADCQFDLGQYPTAVKLYELTASRFTGTMSALQAYVQVVNAYVAMHESAQARAAAERARWMLQRIPEESFAQATPPLSRQYYADLLDLRRFGP